MYYAVEKESKPKDPLLPPPDDVVNNNTDNNTDNDNDNNNLKFSSKSGGGVVVTRRVAGGPGNDRFAHRQPITLPVVGPPVKGGGRGGEGGGTGFPPSSDSTTVSESSNTQHQHVDQHQHQHQPVVVNTICTMLDAVPPMSMGMGGGWVGGVRSRSPRPGSGTSGAGRCWV